MAEQIEETFKEERAAGGGYILGLDLGQSADFSALVVSERVPYRQIRFEKRDFDTEPVEKGFRTLTRHRVVWLHRWPLATSYPAIVQSVKGILAQLPVMPDKPELLIDNTGVGRGVSDIFREERLNPICVSITGGSTVNQVGFFDLRVPKRELASTLLAVMQTDRLEIARELPLSRILEDELSNFRVRITAAGSEQFEGRSGVHDDLVLALCIAVWHGEKKHTGPGAGIFDLAMRELERSGRPAVKPPPRKFLSKGSDEWKARRAREAYLLPAMAWVRSSQKKPADFIAVHGERTWWELVNAGLADTDSQGLAVLTVDGHRELDT